MIKSPKISFPIYRFVAAMRRLMMAAALGASLFACASTPVLFENDPFVAAGLAIADEATTAAERIRADVEYLSDDALEGRDSSSPSYHLATDYVAGRMAQMGLQPGARGHWLQQVPLIASQTDPSVVRAVILPNEENPSSNDHAILQPGDDFIMGQGFACGDIDVQAEVVFVGYGISDARNQHDDYAQIDVTGKVVALFADAPSYYPSEERAFFQSTNYKVSNAQLHGAVGVLLLPTKQSEARYAFARRAAHSDGVQMTWKGKKGLQHRAAEQMEVTAWLSKRGAATLFADCKPADCAFETQFQRQASGLSIAPSFVLDKKIALHSRNILTRSKSANVVGFIEGSDKAKAKEMIVMTAHLDHIGRKSAIEMNIDPHGDHIYNGALDNAMGVAVLLEAARALAVSPPERSVMFVAVTAEEEGLLGSGYFVRHPPVKAAQLIANINVDMPLLLFPFEDVVAFGSARSSLGAAVSTAAQRVGVTLSSDPVPELSIFVRSDHYRFVERGIPSIFLFVGHEGPGAKVFESFMKHHYHQVSDEIALPIDYEAAAGFARLNRVIIEEIAAAPQRPLWHEGDFFAAQFASEAAR